MEGRNVVHNVVEKIPFDLLRQEGMEKILYKLITNHFDTGDAAYMICEKLLSPTALMTPFSAFIKRRTRKAGAISPPSHTGSALISSPLDKNDNFLADKRHPGTSSRSWNRQRRHRKD